MWAWSQYVVSLGGNKVTQWVLEEEDFPKHKTRARATGKGRTFRAKRRRAFTMDFLSSIVSKQPFVSKLCFPDKLVQVYLPLYVPVN